MDRSQGEPPHTVGGEERPSACSGQAISLADDLGVFALRHHVQLQASGDLSVALGALSGEAADELRGILQWHGRQVTAAPAPPAAGAATPRAPGARPAADMRPGDWTCPTCDYHNFASRVMCKRCLGLKDPVSGGAVAAHGSWGSGGWDDGDLGSGGG